MADFEEGVVRKAIVTKWLAESTLSGISGPFNTVKHDSQANAFPYCVLQIPEFRDDGWTCENRRWIATVVFEIRDHNDVDAYTAANAVCAVFGVDPLTLTMDSGRLYQSRPVGGIGRSDSGRLYQSRPVGGVGRSEDDSVHCLTVTYRMRFEFPRS